MKKMYVLLVAVLLIVIAGCTPGNGPTARSNNADLSALTVSSGTLTPAFAAGTTSYTVDVAISVTSITITATKADANATVIINPTQPSDLNVGENTITVTVTAPDGTTTKDYTVTVTAQPITSLTEIAQISNGDAAVAICRDNYVYTVGWSHTANSFNIYDMSVPTTPVLKGHYNIGDGYGLALNGNYAYIQTDGGGTGIFASGTVGVMNITDPANPVPVMQDATGYSSAYQTYYYNGYVYNASHGILGIYRVSDPATLVPVKNIVASDVDWLAFSGNYMYGIDNGTFRIWNITDPTAPVETGSIAHADLDYAGVAVKGNYAFAMCTTGAKVLVFDVSDKAHPTLVTSLTLTSGTSPSLEEARILGNYLLIAGYNDFYVVNIATPTAPVEVTSIPLANHAGWGFDVLNERYAIVADDTLYRVIKLW